MIQYKVIPLTKIRSEELEARLTDLCNKEGWRIVTPIGKRFDFLILAREVEFQQQPFPQQQYYQQ